MISKSIERYKSGIYKITNLINNKIYVGSSKNIYNRKHTHSTKLKNRTHTNKHLENAYHKYGFDNFLFEIIEYCDIALLEDREQYWIDKLKPQYNICLFVKRKGNVIITQECRNKISNTLKKRYRLGEITTYRQDHNWVPIDVYDLNGVFIKSFDCINDATNEMIGKTTSHALEKNKSGIKMCGGFLFIRHGNNPPGKYKNPHFKAIKMYDNVTNTNLYFESKKECAKYFGVKHLKYRDNKIYKKRYYISYVQNKLDKLLETPEEDNQQPIQNLNDSDGFND